MDRCRTAILVMLVLCNSSWASDWPQWLGPNRDGVSQETVAPWTHTPKTLWRQPVGEGHSVPVVADGRLFIHARVAGKEAEELTAFDASTGRQLWQVSYPRAPYFSILNTGPQATPCVVRGHVYTFGITGLLSCFEAASGKQAWQVDVFKQLQARLPRFGTTCSPLVVGDRVLVAVGGKGSAVAALDTGSGALAWKALDGPISTASPIVYLNRAKKNAASVEAVFINGRSLVALNPFDGEVAWEFPLSDQALGTSPSPVVAGDLIVASSVKIGGVGVKLTHADDRTTPTDVWKNADLTGYFCTPVVCGKDYLYFVTSTLLPQPASSLRCIATKTGKESWNQPGIGIFHAGLLRLAGEKILVLNDKGLLRLLQHDARGYRELAQAQVCGATFANPAFANGRLYARDGKAVVCVQLVE